MILIIYCIFLISAYLNGAHAESHAQSTLSSSSRLVTNLQRRQFELTNDMGPDYVTIFPFQLLLGPTRNPLNDEQIQEIRSVVADVLLVQIKALPNPSMQLIADVKLAGVSTVKWRTPKVQLRRREIIEMEIYRGRDGDDGGGRGLNAFTSTANLYTTVIHMEGGEAEFKFSIYELPPFETELNEAILLILSTKALSAIQNIAGLSGIDFLYAFDEINTPVPTPSPTKKPTAQPTSSPSSKPTTYPTLSPSYKPTTYPTLLPTESSVSPTLSPTKGPTTYPTTSPTIKLTEKLTEGPTSSPTKKALSTIKLTKDPTPSPIKNPTPTIKLTKDPTSSPTKNPTQNPMSSPKTQQPTLALVKLGPPNGNKAPLLLSAVGGGIITLLVAFFVKRKISPSNDIKGRREYDRTFDDAPDTINGKIAPLDEQGNYDTNVIDAKHDNNKAIPVHVQQVTADKLSCSGSVYTTNTEDSFENTHTPTIDSPVVGPEKSVQKSESQVVNVNVNPQSTTPPPHIQSTIDLLTPTNFDASLNEFSKSDGPKSDIELFSQTTFMKPEAQYENNIDLLHDGLHEPKSDAELSSQTTLFMKPGEHFENNKNLVLDDESQSHGPKSNFELSLSSQTTFIKPKGQQYENNINHLLDRSQLGEGKLDGALSIPVETRVMKEDNLLFDPLTFQEQKFDIHETSGQHVEEGNLLFDLSQKTKSDVETMPSQTSFMKHESQHVEEGNLLFDLSQKTKSDTEAMPTKTSFMRDEGQDVNDDDLSFIIAQRPSSDVELSPQRSFIQSPMQYQEDDEEFSVDETWNPDDNDYDDDYDDSSPGFGKMC